jgi:hypothetical protein
MIERKTLWLEMFLTTQYLSKTTSSSKSSKENCMINYFIFICVGKRFNPDVCGQIEIKNINIRNSQLSARVDRSDRLPLVFRLTFFHEIKKNC